VAGATQPDSSVTLPEQLASRTTNRTVSDGAAGITRAIGSMNHHRLFRRLLRRPYRVRWHAAAAVLLSVLAYTMPSPARAAKIVTYGTGLETCQAFLDSREQQSDHELNFIDWMSGYLTGVNATPNHHRNNILGASDLQQALYRLVDFCRVNPTRHFADGAGMLLLASNSTPGAHSVDLTEYGAGYKSCRVYMQAREPQSGDGFEFINWLGGYVSGVNAISLQTNNALGSSQLIDAVHWLDGFCDAHLSSSFGDAVTMLLSDRQAPSGSVAAR
jgi:hypothetical protein